MGLLLALTYSSNVHALDDDDSIKGPITTITTNTTLDKTYYTVLADASSGAITVTLPQASTVDRVMFNIKKIDSSVNKVTVDGNGSETIDGSTTFDLTGEDESITIHCDGSSWYIV